MKKEQAESILKKVVVDYNSIAAEFDATRQHSWKEFLDFLPYLKKGAQIADIGCGNGRLLNFLKEKQLSPKYSGIDNSKNLLKAAKKNHPKSNFQLGDLLNIPLNNESQDMVAAIASFHHLPTKELREKSLREIHRILKKEGILIITTWNLFQKRYKKHLWKAFLKWISSLGKYNRRDTFIPWSKSGINRYYYAFKQKELEKLLSQAGFKILESKKGNNILIICQKS